MRSQLQKAAMPTKTFLVEDSATIRANLVPAMRDLADVEVVGCAESESEAVAWLARIQVTCILRWWTSC